MRTINLEQAIEETKREAEALAEKFDMFSTGPRILLMIHRSKDGGGNKETRRVKYHHVYFDHHAFLEGIVKCLWFKMFNEDDIRIYCSVNGRNLTSSIKFIHQNLVECAYTGDSENTQNMYKKVFTDPRTFLMQPANRKDKMFILDVDNEEGKDVLGEVLKKIGENNIEVLFRTPTRNGHHIVTKPFNPQLLGEYSGIINKDGLILMK